LDHSYSAALSNGDSSSSIILYAVTGLLWIIYAVRLRTGLPPLVGIANNIMSITFGSVIFACFHATINLYRRSPLYLLSVMALVWMADTGAFCCGKMFGKRKLAPTISPGKSWEWALGSGTLVLALSWVSVTLAHNAIPSLQDTFAFKLQARFGWTFTFLVLALVTITSVIGDLFESQLKRRACVKDSSNLLPGHGGVLDRIDALLPVLPLAALISAWL
jgi:phosphatidate cytidylyltransferase